MSFVFGLVTEGYNDQTVIRAVIEKLASQQTSEVTVVYRQVQPPRIDATSSGSGGWTEVRKWCLRNQEQDRQRLIFSRSLTGEPACNALIVQLDGDCLHEYAAVSGAPILQEEPWPAAYRAGYVERLLKSWLWPAGQVDKRCVLVVPVQSMETWLAAALDLRWHQPENDDPVPKLIALKPDMEDKSRPGRLRKKRIKKQYKNMAQSLVFNIQSVRRRCRQFDYFCVYIESIFSM